MIESVAVFGQVKVEIFSRHAVVRMVPIFGVAPEAFAAVDVVSADRLAPPSSG